MILQDTIPYDIQAALPLPGIRPLDPSEWVVTDEAYAAQMAERTRLLETRRSEVLMLDEAARPAAEELLDTALGHLPHGFSLEAETVTCPDGRSVPLDRGDPLGTLGRILQEDLCVLEKRGDEHVLTGAVLCFPASWRLDEKFMRPLIGIHEPVDSYDPAIARRVQRLFDGVQPGRPLWRFNALAYADPDLFQPRSESDRRPPVDPDLAPYWRSERQCILRLPDTRAVVFSIHVYVVRRTAGISTADWSGTGSSAPST